MIDLSFLTVSEIHNGREGINKKAETAYVLRSYIGGFIMPLSLIMRKSL